MWPFKSDDWIPIYKEVAEWTYTYITRYIPTNTIISSEDCEATTTYILQYSKSRNKYRIKILGFNNNSDKIYSSPAYLNCLTKQIELQK
jgi:hypothetical protein